MSLPCPLPEGWSVPDIVDDTIVADGISLARSGMSTRNAHGQEVTGAAADADEVPTARGAFELLERVCTIEALRGDATTFELRDVAGRHVGAIAHGDAFPESEEPTEWQYSRSNGIALHETWERAANRA